MSAKNSYKISRSFADALFYSLQKDKTYIKSSADFLSEISKVDLDDFIKLYRADRDSFLSLFDEFADIGLRSSMKEFFLNLAENKKIKFLPQIALVFRELADDYFDLQRVVVILADLKNKNLVEDYLRKDKSKDMVIEFVEDKSLISGFKINFVNENKILDMSIDGVLSRI